MPKVHAGLKLRPTRIGLLVRPTDLASIRRFFRLNTCLWGGVYNPIIPAADELPQEWSETVVPNGLELAGSYLEFFEPDILVEAEPGLAEWSGYGGLERNSYKAQLMNLNELVTRDARGSRLTQGLSAVDAFRGAYERESKFVLRDPPKWILTDEVHTSAFVEAAWGAFPADPGLAYIRGWYEHAFKPVFIEPSPKDWLEHYKTGRSPPLFAAHEGLEFSGFDRQELRLFVFNPDSPLDLIDFWNLRIFHQPVMPVPVGWLPELSNFMREAVDDAYRPMVGNPNGVMEHATVEFARSIGREATESLVEQYLTGCKPDALHVKPWYDNLRSERRRWIAGTERLNVLAAEREVDIDLDENFHGRMETLSPAFAEPHGMAQNRWVNVLSFDHYQDGDEPATIFPLSLEDRGFPQLNTLRDAIVSREGLVLPQRSAGWREFIDLPIGRDAIVGWLNRRKVDATLSGAGRIAQEMIRAVGGLWGTHLLADADLLKLLDKMAASEVSRRNDSDSVVRRFDGKTASVDEWVHLMRRLNSRTFATRTIEDYIDKNVIRLGLSVRCKFCSFDNWYPLGKAAEENTCERCLRRFPFPAEIAHSNSSPWRYRVIGSFAVPNYAEGAYAVALTLRFMQFKLSHDVEMTYSTGLELKFDGLNREIDLFAWYRKGNTFGLADAPRIIFGEAKSFAQEAFKSADIEGLRAGAELFPGAVIIAAKLGPDFSPAEIDLLRGMARWGWGLTRHHPMKNPLVLLAGSELFAGKDISSAWKTRGGRHAKYADSHDLDNLEVLARATQDIYLDLRQTNELTPPSGA